MRRSLKAIKGYLSRYGLGVLVFTPTTTFAATIETVVNNAVSYLQGPVARGAGVLVIVGTGYLCIAQQKMPKERFAMILVGLGVIFGGSSLYSMLVG
ncbi:TrbC/VirB2 family protein [Legionella spiritensis]|uniref:TrbC/VirB2 family protein n=1 Tax=Legionella spiritensis TaxID=452 RepID=UPI000F6B9AB5|nr:TrbC/VirB2 family protein [Legionella spiritensis]VEG91201.1 LvrB2 [Legionella spiritensis]VEG91770.1 LvrB2 [Legionella spiritensis]